MKFISRAVAVSVFIMMMCGAQMVSAQSVPGLTITSLSTNSAKAGDVVTIYGTGLYGNIVDFDGVTLLVYMTNYGVADPSGSTLTFTIPSSANPGTHTIQVEQRIVGGTSNAVSITVVAPSAPGALTPSATSISASFAPNTGKTLVTNFHLTNTSASSITLRVSVPNQPAWLSGYYDPQSVTFQPGAVGNTDVYFDASKAGAPGVYTANIIITGNFVDSPFVIPVTLTVPGAVVTPPAPAVAPPAPVPTPTPLPTLIPTPVPVTPLAPGISSVIPPWGRTGDVITVHGSNLNNVLVILSGTELSASMTNYMYPDATGTYMVFSIPTNSTVGTYTVKVKPKTASVYSNTVSLEVLPPHCTDSDGGTNIDVVGYVDGLIRGVGNTFTDLSVSQNGGVCEGLLCTGVAEGYCTSDLHVSNIVMQCPSGHSEGGRCLPRPLQLASTTVATSSSVATCEVLSSYMKTLTIGMKNNQIREIQKILVKKGYLTVTPTGYYGKATTAAVKRFQKENSITVTGSIGPKTFAKLESYCQK